jgi:zinc transport system permease protein
MYQKTPRAAGLHDYLFGSDALLDGQDLAVLAASTLLALLLVGLFANRLLLVAVSRPLAQARGVAVARHEFLLIVVLALVVAVGVRAIGLLLVNAMLIVPAATSRNLARSLGGLFWGSVLVALVSGLAGLFLSPLFGFAEGPAIVAASVVLFAASQLIRPLLRRQGGEA